MTTAQGTLTNVYIVNPQTDHVLIYDNGIWENSPLKASMLPLYGTAQTLYAPKVTTDAYGRSTLAVVSADTDINVAMNALSYAHNSQTIMVATGAAGGYWNRVTPAVNSYAPGTGIMTVVVPGFYTASCNMIWGGNAVGIRTVQVMHYYAWNSVTWAEAVSQSTPTASVCGVCASASFYAFAGDQIFFYAYQNSGGGLIGNGNMCITYLHP